MAEGRCGGDGAVELSLRLRTGDDGTSVAATEEEAAAAARRSMTIFYNGQVCAVNVTELQARTIISMANQGNFTKQQQRQVVRDDHHHHQADSSSSNSGSFSTAAQRQQKQHCVAGSSRNPAAAAAAVASPPRPGLEAAAAPMMNQAANGLSMKRSLQRFLEKRKTRAAAAAAPLYAGNRPAARR